VSSTQLSGVEVRHLRALRGVVEAGSFRGAAERLGYSQGSVSAQIGALAAGEAF
jgi:DNA-binding transcriptional LysR family regulator